MGLTPPPEGLEGDLGRHTLLPRGGICHSPQGTTASGTVCPALTHYVCQETLDLQNLICNILIFLNIGKI